jgi:hypothetical protein
MKRIQLTENFYLDEFIPKEVYDQFGERAKIFLDPRLPILMEAIRDHFGKGIIINNWATGGTFNNRGFRHPHSGTGGTLSQHKFGRACDYNVDGVLDMEVDKEMIKEFKKFAPLGLTTIENPLFTTGWTHIDTRWTGLDTILQVNP